MLSTKVLHAALFIVAEGQRTELKKKILEKAARYKKDVKESNFREYKTNPYKKETK